MKATTAIVVRATLNKTAVVAVTSTWRHPLYQKIVRRSKKFLVHDEVGVKVGDTVVLKEVRPISKNKHLAISEILKNNL